MLNFSIDGFKDDLSDETFEDFSEIYHWLYWLITTSASQPFLCFPTRPFEWERKYHVAMPVTWKVACLKCCGGLVFWATSPKPCTEKSRCVFLFGVSTNKDGEWLMYLGLPSCIWVTWQVILLYWLATVSGSWWAWLVFIPMGTWTWYHPPFRTPWALKSLQWMGGTCFMVWSKPKQIAGSSERTSYWQHISEECFNFKSHSEACSTTVSYSIIANLLWRDHSSYPRVLPSFLPCWNILICVSCVFPSNMPMSCCLAASGCPKGESTWRDIPFKEGGSVCTNRKSEPSKSMVWCWW